MVTMPHIESKNTLHLLAAAPRFWSVFMPELLAIWQEGDMILLIAEGAQGFNATELNQFNKSVLDSDLIRLEITHEEIPSHLQIATIADWAKWTVQYKRTITWR